MASKKEIILLLKDYECSNCYKMTLIKPDRPWEKVFDGCRYTTKLPVLRICEDFRGAWDYTRWEKINGKS
jgi:hypothetical protein